MNLLYAHELLVAATLSDSKTKSFSAINRLTDFGRTFLRALKDPPGSAPVSSFIVHKIIPSITAS